MVARPSGSLQSYKQWLHNLTSLAMIGYREGKLGPGGHQVHHTSLVAGLAATDEVFDTSHRSIEDVREAQQLQQLPSEL